MTSKRKPYNNVAGYVASLKCQRPCGGHIVIYDRQKGFEIDAEERWIVMHEPSSRHVAVKSLAIARDVMKQVARDVDHAPTADILPEQE